MDYIIVVNYCTWFLLFSIKASSQLAFANLGHDTTALAVSLSWPLHAIAMYALPRSLSTAAADAEERCTDPLN